MPSQIAIAIVGAGIAGLTLANGLLKHDVSQRLHVRVYDKSPAYVKQGYLVFLRNIGIEALQYCLRDDAWLQIEQLIEAGRSYQRLFVVKHTDCKTIRETTPENASIPIQRPTLRQLLVAALESYDANTIQPNKTFKNYTICEPSGELNLGFTDGTAHTVALLIDTSGSNSLIASALGLDNQVRIDRLIILGGGDISGKVLPDPKSLDQGQNNLGQQLAINDLHLPIDPPSSTPPLHQQIDLTSRPIEDIKTLAEQPPALAAVDTQTNHSVQTETSAQEPIIPTEYMKTTFSPLRPQNTHHG